MKQIIKKILRENLESYQDLNEEQIATNQEYIEIFDNVYDWSQNTMDMIGHGDREISSMGLNPEVIKSDSGNLIIKYVVDEQKKVVYMIGLMARDGKFKREDVPDYKLWINRLMEY